MNPLIIDTHCHLDLLEEQGLSITDALKKSKNYGITNIYQIGINYQSSLNSKDIAHKYSTIIDLNYTIGCHPAANVSQQELDQIIALVEINKDDNKLIGIGEIGLDYHHNPGTQDSQIEKFRRCMQLACDYDYPVVIHSRDASLDTIQIIKEFSGKVQGIIHCYTYNYEIARKFIDCGYFISFSGIVTYKSATDIQDTAKRIPLESILIETDAPYLAPMPHRGKRNDSSYLVHTMEKILSLRLESNQKVQETIFQNSKSLLHRKETKLC